jgi:hypothetical protein
MSRALPANRARWFPRLIHVGVAVGLILGRSQIAALADGGTVRLSETKDAYRITALTSPNPLRAGPIDVSVIVQDAATGDVLPEVKVDLRLASREQPSIVRQFAARCGNAANKLYHSAVFDLPLPGWWNVEIGIDGPRGTAHARFEVEAADRLPRWLSLWPWFSWPALVVALFAVQQAFAVNRTPVRPTPAPRRPRRSRDE